MAYQNNRLAVNQLGFERNNQYLFEKFNYQLSSGQILQIRGDNGSGKTTLLRIMAGFIEPHLGTIFWNELSILHNLDHYQKHLHYLGHQNGVRPLLSILENLELNASLVSSKLNTPDLHAIAKQCGLSHLINRQANTLSAGQVRRLAIARLILNPAPLWILDEPLTALDASGQAWFLHLLNEHLANNGMAIIATHQTISLNYPIQTMLLGSDLYVC